MASLANTVVPSQLITGNIKLKDGVYSTQNLQQSDLSINLKDVLTKGSSLPKSELNYEARNIIKDKDQNLYIFGVYGFKDGNLNGGGVGLGNNFKTIGKFIAKIDASANVVYIKDEDPNIQAPWYQTPLIATDSSGSLSLAVNIDNSGGMPSQDGKDVSYEGITLNSNRGGFVKRIASNGDVKWVAPVTGSDIYSYLQSIITDDSGNTYVYWGDINWWASKNITKLDAYGNTVWTVNTFGGGSAYAPYASFVGIDQSGDPLLAADNGRGSPSLFKVNKDSGIAQSLGIAVSQDEWRNFSFISPNNKPTGVPTLSGTFKLGQVISIDKTPIQDADNFSGYSVPYNYNWEVSADGTTWTKLTSTDATDNNSTYTLTTAEVGKKIRGVVSYLDGYGTNEVVYSATSTQVVPLTDSGTGMLAAITGSGAFNKSVTLTAGIIKGDPDGDATNPNYKYQWLLNGIAIQGATTATYKTNVFTGAGTYAVQETYTDAQGFTATINSPSQVVATTPITTSINFSSTPQEGAGEFTASLNVSAGTQASINLADGARIYWKITGIQQADLATGYALAGDGIITNGKLDVKSSLVQDNTQENETFNITLYSDAALTQRVGNTFSSVITADIGSSSSSSASTTTLASTISRLTLTGVADINGTGNSLNNYITGNDGNNIIDGGASNDILAGGKGNDTYIVDSIYDAIIENSNEGTDTVNSSVSWTLGSNLENLNLTGANATNGTGNSLNNVITGNDAANILDGGAGDDILDGEAGNNTLTGGLGADTFKLSYSKFTNTIKDYDPLTDRIEINRSNFGLSNIGSNWSLVQTTSSPNTVAFNNLLAMENRAAFIYNTQTGNLYLNQNATIGYMGSIFARTGNGLLVASFANKPNISATNLNLI